jgi:transcriptional regulator of acetoin/glycerol metabolism
MMTDTESVDIGDLPEYLRLREPSESEPEGAVATLEQVERAHTMRVVGSLGGTKVRAAELLGISRAKLYRILSEQEGR